MSRINSFIDLTTDGGLPNPSVSSKSIGEGGVRLGLPNMYLSSPVPSSIGSQIIMGLSTNLDAQRTVSSVSR